MTAIRQTEPVGRADLIAACLILLAAVLIVVHAVGRQYLNVDTETDFISGFQPEAARFLRGEGLRLEFHPPGYPIALAAFFSIAGDWFAAGLVLSAASAVAVLVVSYLCFRELLGVPAGFGALAALAGSAVFASFSIQATSDMYFLALWISAIWLVVVSMRQQRVWQWALAGLLIAGAVLARTNGVVLLALLIAPLLSGRSLKAGVLNFAVVAVAVAAPVLAWWLYSQSTGSPFMPTKTYANLALTYFADGSRISADSLVLLQSQFSSSLDVLLTDPVRVMRIYLRDLLHLPGKLVSRLTWPPLAVLCLVCGVAWLTRLKDLRALLVLAVTLASVALMNMKAFEARYYLLLLPVAGASIGLAVTWLVNRAADPGRFSSAGSLGMAALVVFALGMSGYGGFSRAENRALSAEFAEIIEEVRGKTPENALLVCRKCNAAFHSGRGTTGFFPEVRNLGELCQYLESLDLVQPTYIVIASMERKLRPEISAELSGSPLPAWLDVTAQGTGGTPWRLLEYREEVECSR
jgi:hypothetical protein